MPLTTHYMPHCMALSTCHTPHTCDAPHTCHTPHSREEAYLAGHAEEVLLAERCVCQLPQQLLRLWADHIDGGVHGCDVTQLHSAPLRQVVAQPGVSTGLLRSGADHEVAEIGGGEGVYRYM